MLAGAVLPYVRPLLAQAAPRYFFRVTEVKASVDADEATKAAAREVLEKDLAGREEFTSDVPGANEAAIAAALKTRKLQGFNVSLRIEELKRELKPPKPGGRLKQLALGVKLSVFGLTLPGAKLAFSGDGEALIESEVVERRLEAETAGLLKDVMVQAVRQAVDQAVAKLSTPKATPYNENKGKRKK